MSRPDEPSRAAAAKAFARACDGGYLPSCNGLGVLYRQGLGVGRDDARAIGLFRRACRGDVSTACEHLSFALVAGQIPVGERAADVALLNDKCLAGDAIVCTNLAELRRARP